MKTNIFIKLRHSFKKISLIRHIYRIFKILFRSTYFEDDIRVSKNVDFLKDDNFIQSKDKAKQHIFNYDYSPDWRLYIELWASSHAIKLEGDFVQCGVDTGYTARAIIEYVKFYKYPEKTFFLYDTYEGLPSDRIPKNEPAAFWNEYRDVYGFVKNAFRDFKNIKIIKGIVLRFSFKGKNK